jgi:hypothetical protein
MDERYPSCPLAILGRRCIHYTALLFLTRALVFNQNRLPFLYRSGEDNQGSVGIE